MSMPGPSSSLPNFDLYDPIPQGICVIDSFFRVVFWNRCMEDWTSIPRNEILDHPLGQFFPTWLHEHYRQRVTTLFHGGPPVLFSPQLHPELFQTTVTVRRTLSITATHLASQDGYFAVITVQDISDLEGRIKALRSVELQLKKSVEEKIMMMREAHHRIKNNLSMISGLIVLQQTRLEDPLTQQILEDLQQRIYAIAQIHDYLYKSSSLTIGKTIEYLAPLAKALAQNLTSEGRVDLDLRMDNEICLDTDRTIALGIIQTELITNSLKYAFNVQNHGFLSIELTQDDHEIFYRFVQSGNTLPDSFDKLQNTGLGMLLLTSFVRQLRGTSQWQKEDPTIFTLRFPR